MIGQNGPIRSDQVLPSKICFLSIYLALINYNKLN
jgi:hypothetical protein